VKFSNCFQIVAGQLDHLQQETQVTALRRGPRAGALKDFDHAFDLVVAAQRGEHEQEIGRVAGLLVSFISGVRLDEHRLAASKDFVQQPAVLNLLFLALCKFRLAEIDLILQLEAAAFAGRPDGAADRRKRRDDTAAELAVELLDRELLLTELRDLIDQTTDLLLGLLNQFRIDRLFSAHAPPLGEGDNYSTRINASNRRTLPLGIRSRQTARVSPSPSQRWHGRRNTTGRNFRYAGDLRAIG